MDRPLTPAVTIVMPAYNRADLIAASIESALAQTYRDFELLVVDDGSTDATRDVVRAFTDPRVRLLERSHAGMSATMNAGVNAARGRYFARLDSDDLWDPRFLELTVAAIERSSKVGVVYPRARMFSEHPGAAQAERGRSLTFPGQSFHSMLVADHASVAALTRVECHQRVGGYDESMPLWEDWDFWVRVSRHYDFELVDEVLAHMRVHGGSVVTRGSAQAWESRRRVLDKVFESGEPLPSGTEAIRGLAYRNLYFDIACAYWQRGQQLGAIRWFRRGVEVSGDRPGATARALYLVGLSNMGRAPYFWSLHGALSRLRRALG